MQFCPPLLGRIAPQWSAEQTERRHEQRGRDYCQQYCHRQKPLRPPAPRTLGLQASSQVLHRKKWIFSSKAMFYPQRNQLLLSMWVDP